MCLPSRRADKHEAIETRTDTARHTGREIQSKTTYKLKKQRNKGTKNLIDFSLDLFFFFFFLLKVVCRAWGFISFADHPYGTFPFTLLYYYLLM